MKNRYEERLPDGEKIVAMTQSEFGVMVATENRIYQLIEVFDQTLPALKPIKFIVKEEDEAMA